MKNNTKTSDASFSHPQQYSLYNGDCLDFMGGIEDSSIDLLLTDPPYNLGRFMKDRNAGFFRMRDNHFVASGWDDLEYQEWVDQMKLFFEQSFRVVKDKGAVVVFMSLIKLETIISLAADAGFYYKTTGIWHKTNPMPRNMNLTFVNSTEAWLYFVKGAATGTFNNEGKVQHDHYEGGLTPMSEKRFGKHPTQKPKKLMEHFVRLLSNEGDKVLDPFMGSGSSGVAAVDLNRKFLGCELDEAYYDIARQRIEEIV